MKKFAPAFALLVAAGLTAPVLAGLGGSIDGVQAESEYRLGSVQRSPTSFGNSTLGQIGAANGSELNTAWYYTDGTHLFLQFNGNLESNFNKFELFIDHKAGGQNQLRGDNPDVDFNGLNRMQGMKFDADFSPDTYITFGRGNNPYEIFANAARLETAGGGQGNFAGTNNGQGVNGALTGGTNFLGMSIAIDNSNTGGVDGSSTADVLSPVTGFEFSIPLSSLGLTLASFNNGIGIAAMINGGGHDFVSSQVLGDGSSQILSNGAHYGNPSNIDFTQFTGNQFFIIPTPGAAALLGLGALAAVRRRRAR